MTISKLTNSVNRTLSRAFILIPLVLAFALAPLTSQGESTFGTSTYSSNSGQTIIPQGGGNNTLFGYYADYYIQSGQNNTAIGSFALQNNFSNNNTATGANALYSNTTGNANTATGLAALFNNTTGNNNIASGVGALFSNTTGHENVAYGNNALSSNNEGEENTAIGDNALASSTGEDADNNTAIGSRALISITNSIGNTAIGRNSGANLIDGGANIILGNESGSNLVSGSFNIYINNAGVADDNRAIRIGDENQDLAFIAGIYDRPVADAKPVVIDASGQLGTTDTSTGLTQGAILQLLKGSPTPTGGFTFLGTTSFSYKSTSGKSVSATLDIYRKN